MQDGRILLTGATGFVGRHVEQRARLKGLTVLYASQAGKHITGQWMAVDGGVSVVLGAA